MSGAQAILLATLCGAVLVGSLRALLPSLHQALARHLGREDKGLPFLPLLFNLALTAALVASGLIANHFGCQAGMVLGSLGAAVGVALLGLSRDYLRALVAVVVLAFGLAQCYTTTVVLFPAAFGSAEQPLAAASLGFAVIGLAFFLMDVFLPWFEKKMGLAHGLLVLALALLAPAAIAGFAPATAFPAIKAGPSASVWLELRLWLAGLTLFLYSPLEPLLAQLLLPYLRELGRSPRMAGIFMAAFWLMFLASRLALIFLPHLLGAWLTVTLIVIAAVILGNLCSIYRTTGSTMGWLLLGACLGPVVPTLIGLMLDLGRDHAALTVAPVLALGAAGNLLLQPPLEGYARARTVRLALRVVMFQALLAAAPALVLCIVYGAE
jgi:fucose permease